MISTIANWVINMLPASSLAAIIANLVTKALANISNKEKLAKISEAVTVTADAVADVGKAVKDGEITEAEVNDVKDSITAAVTAIIEAGK